jgi:hypothetical protein
LSVLIPLNGEPGGNHITGSPHPQTYVAGSVNAGISLIADTRLGG